MKNTIMTGFACVVTLLGVSHARPPVRYMYPTTVSAEYSAVMRGQQVTTAAVESQHRIQLIYLSMAPVEYFQAGLGLGMSRFFTSEYAGRRFDGRYGFAPALYLCGNTPAILNRILRATISVEGLFMTSRDRFDYRYSGLIANPSLGLIIHAGSHVDIELGGRGHLIAGNMENTATSASSTFSNVNNVRGYGAVTMASKKGAFLQLHFDASPAATRDFSAGPSEASIGLSIGALVTPDKTSRQIEKRSNRYFPHFDEMRKKESEMSDQIE